ncbi:lysosomal acid glucosylceramidase-like [Apostichopus japonicus]|uniref:lysosomal acid glucosylceramidase-like n=1 Tax=Stichopus japonicus TaxID=307972 RepID=UPI003AB230DE
MAHINMDVLYVNISWFLVLFLGASGCVKKYGTGNDVTFVCECSADYCDSVEDFDDYVPGRHFVVYTSSKWAGRMVKQIFSIRNLPQYPGTGVTFTVNKRTKYQEILGFGGSFSDSAGINIMGLSETTRENLMKSYFSAEGIEYNMARVPMASTDFSTHEYSYDDVDGDFDLENFALTQEDLSYKIPLIKEAMSLSPAPIKLFASPWSAPGWMKTNGRMKGGGRLFGDPGGQHYKTWANYFARFLEEYEKQGVTFWSLTLQNEPSAGLVPMYDFQCMYLGPNISKEFIKQDLGPTLVARGYGDLKYMILDDQRWLLPQWARSVLSDPEVTPYVNGIALHWYYDRIISTRRLRETHDEFPDYFMLNSEACAGVFFFEGDDVILGSWERGELYSQDILEDLNNWVGAWVDWNLALDLQGGPNWVGNFVDSPIIVDSVNDVFYKQPMFYHLGHFSKFVPPGSVRVEMTAGRPTRLQYIAFQRPDGKMVAIFLNKTERTIQMQIFDVSVGFLSMEVSARGIQTYIW